MNGKRKVFQVGDVVRIIGNHSEWRIDNVLGQLTPTEYDATCIAGPRLGDRLDGNSLPKSELVRRAQQQAEVPKGPPTNELRAGGFAVGDRVAFRGNDWTGVVTGFWHGMLLLRRDDGVPGSGPLGEFVTQPENVRHTPATQDSPASPATKAAIQHANAVVAAKRRPADLFQRLELYARELHAEQVAGGGLAGEVELQACRDGIYSELMRVGAVAAMLDRHMRRLSDLGEIHLTINDSSRLGPARVGQLRAAHLMSRTSPAGRVSR